MGGLGPGYWWVCVRCSRAGTVCDTHIALGLRFWKKRLFYGPGVYKNMSQNSGANMKLRL